MFFHIFCQGQCAYGTLKYSTTAASHVSCDSSVGSPTRYGLDGPEFESRWGEVSAPVKTGSGAHPTSYTMGTLSFPGGKAARM